jgi:RNA polymerase sigma-70 factor (ECF subfamily)
MIGAPPPAEALELLTRAAAGDQEAWREALAPHEERLRLMAALRLNPRLQGRVAPSDVLQETFLQAALGLAEYLRRPQAPFYLWLRGIARNRLLQLHRDHLQAERRDARREAAIDASPQADSVALAAVLAADDTLPSQAAIRAELQRRLYDALEQLQPLDREVLALRHFEQLSNAETAQELGVTPAAASKRYLRALQRLKVILSPTSKLWADPKR